MGRRRTKNGNSRKNPKRQLAMPSKTKVPAGDDDKCRESSEEKSLGLDQAALWVSSAALVVSIIAMGAQIVQWDREGAVFDVKALYEATGLSTFDGTRKLFSQQGQAVIVTNTGRTPGTILDISRQTDNGTRMEVCIPDVDKDGAFAAAESEKAVKLLHDRQVTLQPGESRLVFFSETAKENTSSTNPPTRMDAGGISQSKYVLYEANGKRIEFRLGKKDILDDTVKNHYESLPGFSEAEAQCAGLVQLPET